MKPASQPFPLSPRIYFFESHPVQYKAPVYQALQRICPDSFEVIYATDVSTRPGNIDDGFATAVTWDVPLLSGYSWRVLNNERGKPVTTSNSLTGRGIFSLLRHNRPAAVVLTQFRYRFDHVAYLSALALRIPVLMRQETQDDMNASGRSELKDVLRSCIYRLLYRPLRHAFAFGVLNYQHLLRHGVDRERISFARFSVPNPFESMKLADMENLRLDVRHSLQIPDDAIALAFVGKFVPKKCPHLLLASVKFLPDDIRRRLHVIFVGSGKMQNLLEKTATEIKDAFGVPSSFVGFVNQSRLPAYYLAADIVVLPSSFEETWGLVINEALNAGCATILTKAVGCRHEFSCLERVRVVETGSAEQIADAIVDLARFSRDFIWARSHMTQYSTEAAAQSIANGIAEFLR